MFDILHILFRPLLIAFLLNLVFGVSLKFFFSTLYVGY